MSSPLVKAYRASVKKKSAAKKKNPSAPRRKMRPYGNKHASKRSMRPYGNPAKKAKHSGKMKGKKPAPLGMTEKRCIYIQRPERFGKSEIAFKMNKGVIEFCVNNVCVDKMKCKGDFLTCVRDWWQAIRAKL